MKSSLIVLSLLSVSATAWADGVLKPMHGGVMAEAPSGLRIELAADPAGLAVYLRSHPDKLLASQGVSGDVVLLGAQGKQTAALTPAGDNKLTAALKPQPGAKALVRVTQPGLPVDQVRLSLP